jgi:uncharacterized protein with FMN-binding domain
MRRTIATLLVTAAAVAWLAGYRTHPPRMLNPNSALRIRSTQRAIARPNPHTRTVLGKAITTPFSAIQVAVLLTDGRFTGVKTVELTSDGPHTQALNARAEPILRREALRAHSAHIDIVSGATYTSRAWKTSLQAAIDTARAHGPVR